MQISRAPFLLEEGEGRGVYLLFIKKTTTEIVGIVNKPLEYMNGCVYSQAYHIFCEGNVFVLFLFILMSEFIQ